MVRLLSILALIASLIAPHPGSVAAAVPQHAHAGHAMSAAHHAEPCTDDGCGQEVVQHCCDDMVGHCFIAVIDGGPTPRDASGWDPTAAANRSPHLRPGRPVAHEPPPPRA